MDYKNSKAGHKPAAMSSNKNKKPKANIHSWVNKDIPSAYLISETLNNDLQRAQNNKEALSMFSRFKKLLVENEDE